MSWYEKLLETAKDVAPTVAGGPLWQQAGSNTLELTEQTKGRDHVAI